jgi:hypothetical protein
VSGVCSDTCNTSMILTIPLAIPPAPAVGSKLCSVPVRQLQKQQYTVGMHVSVQIRKPANT